MVMSFWAIQVNPVSNDCMSKSQYLINYSNQSEFLAVFSSLLKVREKQHVQVAIGFGFASHWLKY